MSFARRKPGLLDLSLPTSRAIDSGGRPKGVVHNFRTFRMPPDPRIPETAPQLPQKLHVRMATVLLPFLLGFGEQGANHL